MVEDYNPFFQIKLNLRDLELLKRIQAHFGGAGKISFEKNFAKYTVITVNELMHFVIPSASVVPVVLTTPGTHFEKYSLLILRPRSGDLAL